MENKRGRTENLDPVRTTEEAKRRGRNGGIKSGQVRRAKKNAREAVNMLLDMQAKGQMKESLKAFGIESEDQTNLVALMFKMFTMAANGDIQAFDRLMKISGNDPEERRKERESRTADKIKNEELKLKKQQLEMYQNNENDMDDEEVENVMIYMPFTERDEGMEIKREKM